MIKRLVKLRIWLLGTPLNPFNPEIFRHIALVAFLAWIGLGADGLSSSCYGPEQAFLALGPHTHLALYVALATAITVFVISMGYNQVIELFPSGGGGYKVATQLIGPYSGLLSGAALLIDYVLTIAVSTASGMDALFSFLPNTLLSLKLPTEMAVVLLLILLNLRGMKESVKVLLPIFLGFVVVHFGLITYGILIHKHGLLHVVPDTLHETHNMAQMMGWGAVIALALHSYTLGGGTYTGLEAVSNNVNRLAEPRVRTGQWTMFYMAVSLSFTAGGILLLYLLWQAQPTEGLTLNAVVFGDILGNSLFGHIGLVITLLLEAGLLIVAANTGFLAGPIVLANMAVDGWMPNRFRHLSSRLITQNGVILFGLGALAILWFSHGSVAMLVVLYSINVFITFSLSLLGMCIYWGGDRGTASPQWPARLVFSVFGFLITSAILLITLFAKFTEGGWITILITGTLIGLCLLIKRHYNLVNVKLKEIDSYLLPQLGPETATPPILKPNEPTAIFFVGKDRSVNMHTLLWVLRMFPGHFKNFIFLSVGQVDIESFRGKETLEAMQHEIQSTLDYFVSYCHQQGFAAESYARYGTDTVSKLVQMAKQVNERYPNCIFFGSKLIFENDNWITRLLHNETPLVLQRRLHSLGKQFVILPMRL
ncbi:MAG: amino acid permease [Gammaproteobacteria bacterium]